MTRSTKQHLQTTDCGTDHDLGYTKQFGGSFAVATFLLLSSLTLLGCTRAKYRALADNDSYGIVHEKASIAEWRTENGFTISPDARSRFYDPSDPDRPCLPVPAPQLYAYQLPELPERDPARFRAQAGAGSAESVGDSAELFENATEQSWLQVRAPLQDELALGNSNRRVIQHFPTANNLANNNPYQVQTGFVDPDHAFVGRLSGTIRTVQNSESNQLVASTNQQANWMDSQAGIEPLPEVEYGPQPAFDEKLVQAAAWGELNSLNEALLVFEPAKAAGRAMLLSESAGYTTQQGEASQLAKLPISPEIWADLPPGCLERMLEAESIVEEFELTFAVEPDEQLLDQSPRLSLEDMLELSLINSREYQTQKEQLYLAALQLSAERYRYMLKFAVGGHRTSAAYASAVTGGSTVNTLGVPTNVAVDKALATGGDLVARFANSVILTFNGPQGFTADVGSELITSLSYSVFQRDVQFESLTQAERNVIFAARDYARFRRQFFVSLANQYYNIIRQYRRIEIDTRNYFSLVRAYNESNSEYLKTGRIPRIQVDQVEQQALAGRSTLIGNCTDLEGALDALKLTIGLPTEMPINVDLTELTEITVRDEATVNEELIRRTSRLLQSELAQDDPQVAVLLNGSINVLGRLIGFAKVRAELGDDVIDVADLNLRLANAVATESRLEVQFNRVVLEEEKNAQPPSPPLRIFLRTMDYADSLLLLSANLLDFAELDQRGEFELNRLREKRDILVQRFDSISSATEASNIREQVTVAASLLVEVEALAKEVDDFLEIEELSRDEALQAAKQLSEELLRLIQEYAASGRYNLIPVEVDMDEAMLTALVQRFDLANQRGALADAWRAIKLAGDDLKSVLNLEASHTIRTRDNVNRGFDFTWDENTTQLGLNFDTPVNRRAQRNSYRGALINYQRSLRSLIGLEDGIKSDVRENLRRLQLGREQYKISVASAALAQERVVSTQIQLRLGVDGVATRDFLEAQDDFNSSLTAVANNHISYIQRRIQFFLDLEQVTVNDQGFWEDLYNEGQQPEIKLDFHPCDTPVYGPLPPQLWYSDEIRSSLCVPTGETIIFDDPNRPKPAVLPEVGGTRNDDSEASEGVESSGR